MQAVPLQKAGEAESYKYQTGWRRERLSTEALRWHARYAAPVGRDKRHVRAAPP